MEKLNLGCGQFPRAGYVNVDISVASKADVLCDLHRPLPFRDSSFDEVFASHVLEHISDPFSVMGEIHRILRPGGRALIRVPHFSRGFSHPQHKRGFDVSFPLYFRSDFPGGFTGTSFALERMKLRWFAQPWLKMAVLPKSHYVLASLGGTILDALAALSPAICSRIWCFWVGGFEEIEFSFRK